MIPQKQKFNQKCLSRQQKRELGQALRVAINACFLNGVSEERLKPCLDLIVAGAALTARPGRDTALHLAAQNGYSSVVAALITAGADLNARGSLGQTPMMQTRCPVVLSQLVAAGARLEMRDVNGYTALTHMAHSLQPKLTQMLIDAGAKIDVKTKDGGTAIDLSRANGGFQLSKDIVTALQDRHDQAVVDKAERLRLRLENLDNIAHRGVENVAESAPLPPLAKKPFPGATRGP